MEIFKTFGLDPIIALAQVVNFLIILFILKRFLYKPLFTVLQKRADLAKEIVSKADEGTKALEKAQAEEKEIIKKAQATANQIIKDAKEQSTDMMSQSKVAAKKQTEKMINDAKQQIEMETTQAQAQLNKYVTNLSLELLKKSLGNVFTEKEQSDIIQRAMQEIKKESN